MGQSDYTLIDFVIDKMKSQGFACIGFTGKVGEETLTFKNDAGEVRTVKRGFTPVKRKNYRIIIKQKNSEDNAKSD